MLKQVLDRSGNTCELCAGTDNVSAYLVAPKDGTSNDDFVAACTTCSSQLEAMDSLDVNHWRCLNDSMWSEVNAVKVVAYRVLTALKSEGWPADLLEMIYLEDEALRWAKEGISDDGQKHIDSNGVELFSGDSVVLIKDLKVKGGGFTAKRGTSVKNIRLVHDNPEHIEGKVEGQQIVILTQYVKK